MDTDKYLYNRKTHKNEMNGSSLLNIGIIGLGVGEQHSYCLSKSLRLQCKSNLRF